MHIMTKRTDHRLSIMGGALFGALLLAGWSPAPLSAQDMDARWLPWLGCWEAVDAGEETPLLCVRPASEGNGVEFISWSEGQLSPPEAILADGVPRNVEREECQGVEEARFSEDGHRVYLNSRYVCEEGGERKASGILAMLNPMEWADIKSVDGTPWVLKYRLARASRIEEAPIEDVVASRAGEVKAARISASERLTEEDIIEAVAYVDGPTVEALIVERADPFAMNSDLLIRLDDAGVPENVIDLMVAVSYPDRFAVKAGPMPVEELEDEDAQARRRMYMGGGMWGPRFSRYGYFYSPWYFDMAYGYGGYGYGSYYGYGGWGYGGWGGYGYPYQPRPIVVTPISGEPGRSIKGRGYTRGGAGSGYTGRTARPRGGSSSGGGRATASPSGRSSGGSSTGRSAKPRGGGSPSVSSTSRSSSSSSSVRRTAKPRGGGGLW